MRVAGFVRNVMVGRQGLTRDVLLGLVAEAGGRAARSHLATGNVTFDVAPRSAAAVGRRLGLAISAVVGHTEPVMLRPLPWLAALVERDPFAAWGPGWSREVTFLAAEGPALDAALLALPTGRHLVAAVDRTVLSVAPAEEQVSMNKILERQVGEPASSRAWSTVVRVSARR